MIPDGDEGGRVGAGTIAVNGGVVITESDLRRHHVAAPRAAATPDRQLALGPAVSAARAQRWAIIAGWTPSSGSSATSSG